MFIGRELSFFNEEFRGIWIMKYSDEEENFYGLYTTSVTQLLSNKVSP